MKSEICHGNAISEGANIWGTICLAVSFNEIFHTPFFENLLT